MPVRRSQHPEEEFREQQRIEIPLTRKGVLQDFRDPDQPWPAVGFVFRARRSASCLAKVFLGQTQPVFAGSRQSAVEPLDDDTKLVVRFNAVGVKTLRAKFAKLEPA